MKIKGDTIPGLKVSEYFLVLDLNEQIEKRAEHIREALYASCEVNLRLVGRPVMGLAHFAQYEQVEERMINLFHKVAMNTSRFEIRLNAIGSIPFHTIYIDVEKSTSLSDLVSAINKEGKKFFQLNKETTAMPMRKPHITLTRKLDQKQYETCMEVAAGISIDEVFPAESITLLRRTPGTRQWQQAGHFKLEGRELNSRQGELF